MIRLPPSVFRLFLFAACCLLFVATTHHTPNFVVTAAACQLRTNDRQEPAITRDLQKNLDALYHETDKPKLPRRLPASSVDVERILLRRAEATV